MTCFTPLIISISMASLLRDPAHENPPPYLSERTRRLQCVSGRRRLGDRKPYRAVGADGVLPVPDRACFARRLPGLQESGRPGRRSDAAGLAEPGRRCTGGANPRRADPDARRCADIRRRAVAEFFLFWCCVFLCGV